MISGIDTVHSGPMDSAAFRTQSRQGLSLELLARHILALAREVHETPGSKIEDVAWRLLEDFGPTIRRAVWYLSTSDTNVASVDAALLIALRSEDRLVLRLRG
jgi:hypothetical protein